MEQTLIKDLPVEKGYPIAHLLRITNLEMRESKRGHFLMYTLGDKSGDLSHCKKWESNPDEFEKLKTTKFVFIRGKTDVWQEQLSILADSIAIPHPDELTNEAVGLLIPTSAYETNFLKKTFWKYIQRMENPYLRKLSEIFLEDPEVKEKLAVSPAAVKFHHSYRGGLLTHIVRLMYIVDDVVDSFNNHMYPNGRYKINKDLLITGAFFHDLYKISEYSIDGEYDNRGKLIPHLPRGAIEANRKMDHIEGFPEELRWQVTHLLLSHHGLIEWGSPVTPCTVEAQLFHMIDNLAAKIDPMLEALDSLKPGQIWTDRIPAIGRNNAYLGGMMLEELGYGETEDESENDE